MLRSCCVHWGRGSALVERRIESVDANPASPSSCTLSQRLRMVSQSSPVRFSSVAFATCAVGVIRRTEKGTLTDEIVVRRWLRAFEHDRRGRWLTVCAWSCSTVNKYCGGDVAQYMYAISHSRCLLPTLHYTRRSATSTYPSFILSFSFFLCSSYGPK